MIREYLTQWRNKRMEADRKRRMRAIQDAFWIDRRDDCFVVVCNHYVIHKFESSMTCEDAMREYNNIISTAVKYDGR